MAFPFCAVLNSQGWAQTLSADNWLSMHNLQQGFVSAFAVCPASKLSATVMMVAKENSGYILCVCLCVCICVYPSQALSSFKPGSFRSYSLEQT